MRNPRRAGVWLSESDFIPGMMLHSLRQGTKAAMTCLKGVSDAPPGGVKSASVEKPKVMHFVTGRFTGSTHVAIALSEAGRAGGRVEVLLVLRCKRQEDRDAALKLRRSGLEVAVVPGWSHSATILSLVQICRRWGPDILVAHGFSEHLWGRYAGLLAGVPHLVHVEHNTREPYTRWRLAQSRWLAARSSRIVGCSEGVRRALLAMELPPEKTIAIPNGIDLEPFVAADALDFAARKPGIVMAARFSRQKDHPTLLHAISLLQRTGLRPPVLLAGSLGKESRAIEDLADRLGLQDQVSFAGARSDMPQLLLAHRISALITHYEGMPLSLIEGMAAGCAVVGSAVPGVREVIEDGVNGLLVPEGDAPALASALERLLTDPGLAGALGRVGRQTAVREYGRERMNARYEQLFLDLAGTRR